MSNNLAMGEPGQYLVAGDGMMITASSGWQSLELNLPSDQNFKDMVSRIEAIEKRLAILIPNEGLQARFPALQEAYDHYKLIEKLVNDQKNMAG
jgi:hypothetical protein